ncbi:MAG: cytochrome b/b6 domain-containing protein [Bacteroidota bacterium]
MSTSETDDGRGRAIQKHPRAVRWMHWINFPLLTVMIWSGLLIYWAYDPYRIGWGSWTLVAFFPDAFYEALGLTRQLAKGMAYHYFFGVLFTLNGVFYILYTAISGEWRHLVPDRRDWKESFQVVLHDLRLRKEAPPQGRYNAAQKISYTGVIVMGIGSVLTGLAIYKPTQLALLTTLFGGYQSARTIHFILTVLYVLFFVVHIAQVARAGWSNFWSMVMGYERLPAEEATANTDTTDS